MLVACPPTPTTLFRPPIGTIVPAPVHRSLHEHLDEIVPGFGGRLHEIRPRVQEMARKKKSYTTHFNFLSRIFGKVN
jgi:hypothetical protein